MSEENVESIRRGYELFNRGDIDALLQSYDPEVGRQTRTRDIPATRE